MRLFLIISTKYSLSSAGYRLVTTVQIAVLTGIKKVGTTAPLREPVEAHVQPWLFLDMRASWYFIVGISLKRQAQLEERKKDKNEASVCGASFARELA